MNKNESGIILVSGLPRSGTSMMMQMLEAGGIEPVVDGVRKADEDNPKGYYELEKIKALDTDSAWLGSACGKAVKIISFWLYHLPRENTYKIIFMQREMAEILASQKTMLKRRGQPTDKTSDQVMAEKFTIHLKKLSNWLDQQSNMQSIDIFYNKIILNPAEQSRKINRFLGNRLDVDKMAGVVDSSFYRQRKTPESQLNGQKIGFY